jgi:NAD(P)-dependent dehydrogenase (short-subunit alcohol dehydrogenase family)
VTAPRVALVTGGGRGIGRAIAGRLSADGWQVAVTGRTPASLEEAVAAGKASLALPGDATDRTAVAEAVARTEAELGPLSLVVANAGRFRAAGPVWESDPEQWWRDVEVNLRGPLLLLHAVLPGMLARGAGRVVCVGSGIATRPSPYASAYSSSKAALMRLVDSVAAELAGTGVHAFTVSPGLVATEMTEFPEEFLAHRPDWRGRARREGLPAERVAGLVVDLANGRHDALSGRFVHVTDDLALAAAGAGDEESGTLRLVPWAPPG